MGNCGEKSIILYIHFIPMKFTGTVNGKMDAKGRVFFPASFRKKLAEGEVEFVLRKDLFQPCLVVYPVTIWEEEVRSLRARLNHWNPREAMVLRQFMADAEEFTLDASGRFLLSKRMQQLAGLQKDMLFVGMDDRFEIWDPTTMDSAFLPADDLGASLQQLMETTL